jgi:hypothetical protein
VGAVRNERHTLRELYLVCGGNITISSERSCVQKTYIAKFILTAIKSEYRVMIYNLIVRVCAELTW